MKIVELIKEQARLEMAIRAERVRLIRKELVARLDNSTSADHVADELEQKINSKLALVAYCHVEFDDLLDQLEAHLDL